VRALAQVSFRIASGLAVVLVDRALGSLILLLWRAVRRACTALRDRVKELLHGPFAHARQPEGGPRETSLALPPLWSSASG